MIYRAHGNAPPRDDDRERRQRRNEEEDRRPSPGIDQPAADHGPHGRCKGRCSCPYADGTTAFLFTEVSADEGQAIRDKQGAADALDQARHRQQKQGGCKRTGKGADSENDCPGHEDPTQTKPVAERAPDQHEGPEHQQIRVDDPHHSRRSRPQLRLNGRQCKIDDRAFDEGQAGPQDRCRKDPRLVPLRTREQAAGMGRVTGLSCAIGQGHGAVYTCK